MSPVQTRSRSSLVAAAPMKEMALLKRSTGSLKRGRVSMTPKRSLSSASSANSSSSCHPALAAAASRRGGKMACRNKEFRVEIRGPDTNVCSHISMSKGNECGAASAVVHASYGAGHADNAESMAQTTVIKSNHHEAGPSDDGNMDACAIGGIQPLQTAPLELLEEWWDEESSCSTPKAAECRIPVDACLVCPPAPRKRKAEARLNDGNSPFPPSARCESPPLMILPHFIDAFFVCAERGSF
ncbi:hypothetical protein GOP47_0015121 [Adiantum capillus-veneris]|uniref:Uncharacterized protein n=1 Tax=Adiantum capillus-veneris TaxID=13818 RepID=A0A9D4ZCS9_ADICA|nr:hypothetical protein GOP47_0015121 [Adiantum capillus-veneris]